jgi:arsenical pump membrane protein
LSVLARSAPLLLGVIGGTAAVIAWLCDADAAGQAAGQAWPAFALVTGLLLIGLVAAKDRLFSAAGHWLAGITSSGRSLFIGMAAMMVTVTALLNLDTSVAFLTPVAAYTARRRGEDGAVLLMTCLLLSNAGSLLLPGSNLTNLIVLGHLHLSGAGFVSRMGWPWLFATVVTTGVVAGFGWRQLSHRVRPTEEPDRPVLSLGLMSVAAAAVCVLLLHSPAIPVLAIGLVAAGVEIARRRLPARSVPDVLGAPILVGLFGLAVALGVLGRDWAGPARAMGHLDSWATAGAAAGVSVLVNNLPAASLLAARRPHHPFSLLIGLNIGPNLLPSGSLAWVLWMRAARQAGTVPPVRRTVKAGLVAVPLALAAAVAGLMLGRFT